MRHYYTSRYRRDKLRKNNRFVRLYGLFYDLNGKTYGYIEHSFSMSFSEERVRAWGLANAQHYLSRFQRRERIAKRRGHETGRRYFLVCLTKQSPRGNIQIDFSEWQTKQRNYGYRNVPFKIREEV